MVRGFIFLLCFPFSAQANLKIDNTLTSYINSYYLAESKIEDFDNELNRSLKSNQGHFLARSPRYRELLALRRMVEGKAHSIAEAYAKLLETSQKAQNEGARAELERFHTKIRSLNIADRIATNDLLREVREELVRRRIEPNRSGDLPVFFATLEQELAARDASGPAIAERTARAKANSDTNNEMQALARESDLSFLLDEPKPNGFQPSPGPDGNITGYTFPENTWALTYDDGPSDKYTPGMAENLLKHGKKATFLWLAECIVLFPDIVNKIRAFGFPTNNHSYTHADLSKANPETLTFEIVTALEKETEAYGEKPRFFRLPYGAGMQKPPVRQIIADNGMIHVFWNVDSLDWKDKRPDHILARVKKQMLIEKRGIILFHDIHPQSVEASKLLLQYSASLDGSPKQHRWVTIPEIVDELNNSTHP